MAYQPPPGGYGGYPPQGYPNQYPPPGQQPPQGYGQPPQGYPNQYPPPGQQPYTSPPPGQPAYGAYPPPPQAGYAPPPQQQQYPAYGAPQQQPYGAAPTYGAPPMQPYGAPPPQQYPPQQPAAYGASAPQTYAQPPPQSFGPPTPASPGYGPPMHIAWDATADADGLRKAMKGFGTDEKALISILANKDPHQMALIRQVYNQRHKRNLEADVAGETGGYFEEACLAIIRGPLQQDVYLLHRAMDGPGTKEVVLNDVLLSRSNADMAAIKSAYQRTYHQSLENAIKADLSMKTERHFLMVLAGNRAEDSAQVIQQHIDQDVMDIYKATEGKAGTDELLVCSILTSRNDAQIRAIAHAYQAKFTKDLEVVIKKEFSGHMEDALLMQLRGGKDRIMRDAVLLEDSMAGMGTKDELLINRVVRFHWDRNHMQQVKSAYRQRFSRDLAAKIRSETSGDYEKLMVACIGG